MTLRIDIRDDTKQLAGRLDREGRVLMPKIINQAVNRTATQVQSSAVKALSKETGLKQKDVRSFMKLFRSNFRTLTATVQGFGRALNLARFRARQTKRGVVAFAWGVRRLYRGAFFANENRTVFRRKGRSRLPIRSMYGPSIPREMAREAVSTALRKVVKVRFPINFEQARRRFLRFKR